MTYVPPLQVPCRAAKGLQKDGLLSKGKGDFTGSHQSPGANRPFRSTLVFKSRDEIRRNHHRLFAAPKGIQQAKEVKVLHRREFALMVSLLWATFLSSQKEARAKEEMMDENVAASLRFLKVLGSGGYKTVYLVEGEGAQRWALAVERMVGIHFQTMAYCQEEIVCNLARYWMSEYNFLYISTCMSIHS
jgi:hypothetical protein